MYYDKTKVNNMIYESTYTAQSPRKLTETNTYVFNEVRGDYKEELASKRHICDVNYRVKRTREKITHNRKRDIIMFTLLFE